jgi:hypothetical protein
MHAPCQDALGRVGGDSAGPAASTPTRMPMPGMPGNAAGELSLRSRPPFSLPCFDCPAPTFDCPLPPPTAHDAQPPLRVASPVSRPFPLTPDGRPIGAQHPIHMCVLTRTA